MNFVAIQLKFYITYICKLFGLKKANGINLFGQERKVYIHTKKLSKREQVQIFPRFVFFKHYEKVSGSLIKAYKIYVYCSTKTIYLHCTDLEYTKDLNNIKKI